MPSPAKSFFRSPLAPTIITLLVIVVGGIGAVYPEEIKKGFPFHWHPMPLEAEIFWSLTLITSMAFFFRQREDDRAREDAQKLVLQKAQALAEAQQLALQKAQDLEHLVRTLPPANFLSTFAELYDEAEAMGTIALGASTAASLEASARVILRLIATLAQEFDGAYPDVRYAANVMLFKPSSSLSAEEKAAISKRLRFCEDATAIDNLKGVLDLEVALSTVSNDENGEPDSELKPVALPIPSKSKTADGKYKSLPGAPLAFIDREADLYDDALNLEKWCDQFGDFTFQVKRELREYFTTHKKVIRSFISIPIFHRNDDGRDDTATDPFAVLNIHCSKENLLKEPGEPLRHFISIVRPMQIMLGKMILARIKLGQTPPNVLAKTSEPAKLSS